MKSENGNAGFREGIYTSRYPAMRGMPYTAMRGMSYTALRGLTFVDPHSKAFQAEFFTSLFGCFRLENFLRFSEIWKQTLVYHFPKILVIILQKHTKLNITCILLDYVHSFNLLHNTLSSKDQRTQPDDRNNIEFSPILRICFLNLT